MWHTGGNFTLTRIRPLFTAAPRVLQSDSGQKYGCFTTALMKQDKHPIYVIVGAAVKTHFPVMRVSFVLSGDLNGFWPAALDSCGSHASRQWPRGVTEMNITLHSVPHDCQRGSTMTRHPSASQADVKQLMKTGDSHTHVSSQFIFTEREVPPAYVPPPRELTGHPLPTAKVAQRDQHSESSGRSTSGCGM